MAGEFENESSKGLVAKVLAAVAVVAVCIVVAVLAVSVLFPQLKEQGTVSLRNAIVQSANQCYAIEGAYPYNLSYLEENYGLVVNHADYSVTYEVFADNVAPSVVVVER